MLVAHGVVAVYDANSLCEVIGGGVYSGLLLFKLEV